MSTPCDMAGGVKALATPAPAPGALAGLSLAVLLSTLNTSIVNTALPVLGDAFRAPFGAVQWTVLSYVLAITALVVGLGRLADIAGPKRMLVSGLVLFLAAAVVCGCAPGLGWVIGARFFQGLGAAAMMSIALALVGGVVGREKAGRAVGLLGTMSAVGTAMGPALGGLLTAWFGWRAIFLVNVPICAVAVGLVVRHLPPDAPRTGCGAPRFDAPGSLVLALGLGAYALGMTTAGRSGLGWGNVGLLGGAAATMLVFLRMQRHAAAPLIEVDLLEDGALRGNLAMSSLVAAVMMSTLVVGPYYLAGALDLDPAAAGAVLAFGPFAAAGTAYPAGRLVDARGTHLATALGLSVAVAGCAGLTILPSGWGVSGYVIPVILLTAGYSLFQTANNSEVLKNATGDRRGLVSGLLNLARNLGNITGAAGLGALFALAAGSHDVASAEAGTIAQAVRVTFGTATGMLLLALAIALRAWWHVRARHEDASLRPRLPTPGAAR